MRRKIDNLGRLVVPVEMKREIGLDNGSEVDMEIEGDKIVLTNPKDKFKDWLIEQELDVILQKYIELKKD